MFCAARPVSVAAAKSRGGGAGCSEMEDRAVHSGEIHVIVGPMFAGNTMVLSPYGMGFSMFVQASRIEYKKNNDHDKPIDKVRKREKRNRKRNIQISPFEKEALFTVATLTRLKNELSYDEGVIFGGITSPSKEPSMENAAKNEFGLSGIRGGMKFDEVYSSTSLDIDVKLPNNSTSLFLESPFDHIPQLHALYHIVEL
ncbi:hypothetical protein GUJ93_ZPchr0002g22943 [Zizania palustris]|uniref:Uncharacterized protein n=1 Tax=Zizania palustris TaxID=103762 RepID=A0A8J5VHT2_ZIZPA|nr:hypothetical protein GUJ93_ZPchr0002g22943 [Zizania palustris]